VLSARIAGCRIKANDMKIGGEIKKITNQTSHILGLGIDISKNKANICIKEDSRVLENFIVTNDQKGIAILINKLDSYINKRGGGEGKQQQPRYLIKAAIESTANMWITMYE